MTAKGPVIGTVPLGKQTINLREGTSCTLHELEGQRLVGAVLAGLSLPDGVSVCVDCLKRVRDFLDEKQKQRNP